MGLLSDLKHAFRLYWRTPVSSLIVIVVLAVGMAFVSSFLSLYVDLILRPHPGIERSSRIVTIGTTADGGVFGLPINLIDRMADEVTSLEAVAGAMTTELAVGRERDFQLVRVVTRDYFSGIRPKLALGRGFEEADHAADAEPVVVISDDYWREQFDRSPDVLGRVIEVSTGQRGPQEQTTDFQIVGVLVPETQRLAYEEVGLWLPFERGIQLTFLPEMLERVRRSLPVESLGRLARGASAEAVAREIDTRYSASDEYGLPAGARLDAIAGVVRNMNVHRDAQRQLQLFLVASLLLALVAAVNVSLFLLARAPGRRRELAVRMSVGAPTKRLARQLASESGLLVFASAALGLLGSIWLSKFLRGLSFLRQAQWDHVTLLDWRVLGLVGTFLMLLTLAVSLAPILGLKRLGIAASSRQVAARATWAQRIAGTAQIAISGMLGGAAVAFAWYLGTLLLGYPGYETDNLYRAEFVRRDFSADGQTITGSVTPWILAQARQREAIGSLPGVTDVSFGFPVPGDYSRPGTRTISAPDDPTRILTFRTGNLDERFIEMLGLRLHYGRAPNEGELDVAVVNQTAARLYFGRDDVVGESVPIGYQGGGRAEIIGVLEELSFTHPSEDVEPIIFLTASQMAFDVPVAIIKSPLSAADLQREIQGLIDSGAIEVDFEYLTSLAGLRSNRIAPDRARGFLTIGAATLVVLLAAFGFYGTQHYLVTAGRREYAIRASLGAGPNALGRLVYRRGIFLSLPGLVVGALLAFIVVAWLRDDFVSRDISPGAVTVVVIAGLTTLLLLASLGPARRARRTQPAPLLRED